MKLLLPFAALLPLGLYLPPAQPAQDAAQPRERTVAILLYDGVELLDFAGPGEAFSAARAGHGHAFRVVTVAKTRDPLRSQGFVEIVPQFTIADCPKTDIVVVPGGNVPEGDNELQRWVKERAGSSELMMSVCNGALLYGATGLLDGLEVTTHRSALQSLALIAPKATVLSNRRFVDSGRVMTCAGVSAGIDGALHVIERMLGAEEARKVAHYMEYDWRPEEIVKLHAQAGQRADSVACAGLAAAVQERGLQRALAEYKALKDAPSESQLNADGYALMNSGQAERALALFNLAAAAFPTSANAADSLSEAYEIQGDRNAALKYAEEALVRLKQETALPAERVKLLHNASASRFARLSDGDKSALRFACPPCGRPCDEVRYLEATQCPGCPMTLAEAGKEKTW